MARTATVTKKSVTLTQDKLYSITLNLLYKEDTTTLIDRDFSGQYRSGDAPSVIVAKITAEMQAVIDNYKAEQTIYNAAALNTAVTNIQNGLVV